VDRNESNVTTPQGGEAKKVVLNVLFITKCDQEDIFVIKSTDRNEDTYGGPVIKRTWAEVLLITYVAQKRDVRGWTGTRPT
jgi:hypothetical protein